MAQTVKRIYLQWGRPGFDLLMGKMPWRREWQPTPIFLPGEFLRQRSLVATVHRVRKSQKQLSNQHTNTHTHTHTLSLSLSLSLSLFLAILKYNSGFPALVPERFLWFSFSSCLCVQLGAVICSLTSHLLHVYKEGLISQFVQLLICC